MAFASFAALLRVALLLPAAGLAPNFDSFLGKAGGRWRGATYTWSPTDDDDKPGLPLGVSPGFITKPVPSSTVVEEVMRSCGGAVQGVKELREPNAGGVTLNRHTDGTTFFDQGSWAMAPAQLSDGGAEEDMLCSKDTFGLQVCLAHADATRRRMLLVIVGGELACCDVAIEGRAGAYAGEAVAEADTLASAAEALLARRLQVVVEARAWEGGASSLELSGTPPAGAPWTNARTGWAEEVEAVDGGSGLVPPGATYLPGGAWVRVGRSKRGGISVEAGSVAPEAAEVAAIVHEFDGGGSLARVAFRKVEALDLED